jgi:PAS domain S-box-containing protein
MLQLQLFLFVSSVPLLLLSALIQEQQRTAHALRVSHRRYRAVVEDQTELICRFGPDGALTFVNGACCRAWGRSPQELLGSDFGALVPAARDGGGLPVAGSLTPERPVASWELERAPEAGERRWEHWSVRALFDAGGAVVDYQAVGRDITESKRAEHQHDLLEAQRALAEALRETDRRKDEFLATLAHELRGPLAPITMAVELLRGLPSADEETDTAREIIRRQTAQLARLVDDLLDISRITSDTIQLRPETVDLGSVVASAIEANKPIIALRELVVATSLPAQPLAVRGDTARLAQVVSNLLHNAAKYTAAGGRIDLDARREEEEAVLRITDTGAGIPADMLERVFEPFTQVDRRRDGELGGLGLGLPLVARLVELHGGSVSAFSEGPGRGSTFVIRLPALVPADERPPVTGGEERGAAEAAATEVAAVAAAPAGTRAAATPATTPLQVLVVDDVADAAAMLARLLTQHGFSVKVAHNGRTALDMVDRFDPDVAFVDLMMPEVDGLEVARQVRGRSASARMLLVAVTGFGQPGDRHRALEAGFDHHLTKPIDLGTLLALLAEVPSRASRV